MAAIEITDITKFTQFLERDVRGGVGFGIVFFNQRRGELGHLLQRMYGHDRGEFERLFGGYTKDLLDEEKVKSKIDFNAGDLRLRLERSGTDLGFQDVQVSVARELFFDPAAKVMLNNGLSSGRALAFGFDLAQQFSFTQLTRFVRQALRRAKLAGDLSEKNVLTTLAKIADEEYFLKRGLKRSDRRTQLLSDVRLSDAAVSASRVTQKEVVIDAGGVSGATKVEPKEDRSQVGKPPWEEPVRHGAMWDHVRRVEYDDSGLQRSRAVKLPG